MAKKAAPVRIVTAEHTDDHLGRAVEIRCEGADVVNIDKLQDFQGSLKSLSEIDYHRLKSSIVDLGFSFPVAAWKERNKIWILDAHQRVATLKRMREEGYVIPDLPVIWVHAEDKKEAAKKLLAATSQYGQMHDDGLFSFMEQYSLTISEVESTFRFPEIKLEDFREEYYPDEPSFVADAEDANEDASPPEVEGETPYTKKIKAPIYRPSGPKPDIYDLYDLDKALDLVKEIEASDLAPSEKTFLKHAAYRHTVFNYEKAAEYYAHASPRMQELMEKSALVIIDFDKAIENGFVVLSEEIAESYKNG